MKLHLKKLKIYETASNKSICFHADLWVDDMCVAEVKNTGEGEPHKWKIVNYYQKFKPHEIEAKLKNAQAVVGGERALDEWVNQAVEEMRQQKHLQASLKADETVEIDDITGEPVIKKKEKTDWKPKHGKVKVSKQKESNSPWIELIHKGQTFTVQHVGITNSHGKDYNKYRTKEGKIIHQAVGKKPVEKKQKPHIDESL